MKFKHACAAAALAAAVAPVPAVAQLSESVAVIVNDEVISTYDVRQRANLLVISAGMTSTPELLERARSQAMRDLVDENLQVQEARTFDIAITREEIDRRIDDIASSNNVDRPTLVSQLAQSGVGESTLRRQIEADIAWSRLMRGLYGSRVRVSDNEVRETQERIAASATRPQYQLSEIFIPAETDEEFAEAEAGAMRLLEEMQRGAPFPLVARQFSASPSAAANGDLGWLGQGELAPELQPVVDRLQPGQVSLPVRTRTGVYIIALRDRRAGAPAGSTSIVSLRQINAPEARADALDRAVRRLEGCGEVDRIASTIDGAETLDLGSTSESDLSPQIRERIAGVSVGAASTVQSANGQANVIVVCNRAAGGGGVPSADEISDRLFEQEMALLSERYLRNLRREATIIQR